MCHWLRGSSLLLPSLLIALLPLLQAAEQAAAGRGHTQPVQTPGTGGSWALSLSPFPAGHSWALLLAPLPTHRGSQVLLSCLKHSQQIKP